MVKYRNSNKKIVLIGLTAGILILVVIGIGLFSKGTFLNRKTIPSPKSAQYKIPATPPQPVGDASASESAVFAPAIDSPSSARIEQEAPGSAVFDLSEPTDENQMIDRVPPSGVTGLAASEEKVADTPEPADIAPAEKPLPEAAPVGQAEEMPVPIPTPPAQQPIAVSAPEGQSPPEREVTAGEGDFFYSIQVGAFKSKTNAQRKSEQMRTSGYDAFIASISGEAITLHAVRFGHFATLKMARESLVVFIEKEKDTAIIVRMEEY